MSLYYLLFLRMYRWSERVNGRYENHRLNAVTMVTALLLIDVCSIYILLSLLFEGTGWLLKSIALWEVAVGSLVAFAVNFLLLGREVRAERIFSRCSHMEKMARPRMLVRVFVVTSLALFLASWSLLMFT